MANRFQGDSATANRENIDTKAPKFKVPRPLGLMRRPALDELSNKLNGQTKTIAPSKEKPVFTLSKAYSSQQLDAIVDPDASSKGDPLLVTDYIAEIYEHLRKLETKFLIKDTFLEGHKTTPKMRAILVNWLVEVQGNFRLCLETLYSCMSIVDRYLQDSKDVGRETLQLVGATAMFIACKYEEVCSPDITDFVYICNDTYSKRQIIRMEMSILKKLDFTLGRPLPIHFLRRYSKIDNCSSDNHILAKYILELALLDHNYSSVKPSFQAAAAFSLATTVLKEMSCPSKAWTPTLVHYTTLRYSDFRQVVAKFAKMLVATPQAKHKAVQEKYAAAEFKKISLNPKLKGSLVNRIANLIKS